MSFNVDIFKYNNWLKTTVFKIVINNIPSYPSASITNKSKFVKLYLSNTSFNVREFTFSFIISLLLTPCFSKCFFLKELILICVYHNLLIGFDLLYKYIVIYFHLKLQNFQKIFE